MTTSTAHHNIHDVAPCECRSERFDYHSKDAAVDPDTVGAKATLPQCIAALRETILSTVQRWKQHPTSGGDWHLKDLAAYSSAFAYAAEHPGHSGWRHAVNDLATYNHVFGDFLDVYENGEPSRPTEGAVLDSIAALAGPRQREKMEHTIALCKTERHERIRRVVQSTLAYAVDTSMHIDETAEDWRLVERSTREALPALARLASDVVDMTADQAEAAFEAATEVVPQLIQEMKWLDEYPLSYPETEAFGGRSVREGWTPVFTVEALNHFFAEKIADAFRTAE